MKSFHRLRTRSGSAVVKCPAHDPSAISSCAWRNLILRPSWAFASRACVAGRVQSALLHDRNDEEDK